MLHLTEFKFEDKGPKRAVLIDVPENFFPNDIANELHSHHRNKLHSVDLILLRPSVWMSWDPAAAKNNVDSVFDRFPGASVQLLVSKNFKHLIVKNTNDTQHFQFEKDQQSFLDKVRTEELKQLVKRSEALYLSDSASVFRHPSHILSKSFLRVGNIQTSRGALDLLFFWLLPYLSGVEGILIDTWSISSIALNASRLLGTYKPRNNSLVKVEMLDNYLDSRMETREELEEVLRRISDGFQSPFLIVFSATMTGKSLECFSSALSAIGCPVELQKYLILFRLGSIPIKVNGNIVPELCDFSSEIPTNPEKSKRVVKTEIKIDPTTYFPTFTIEKEVHLTNKIAEKHKKFFDRYKTQKVIRIHENSKVGGQKLRHHGICLDVLLMLENQHFISKFEKIIDNLNPHPKLILVPPHDAGRKLASIAASQLTNGNQRPTIIEHLDLITPSSDMDAINEMKEFHKKIKQINQNEALLVLDDVMTTGSRFLGYQRRLRQLGFSGQIHYRAGVSRTSSVAERKKIEQTLKPNNTGTSHTIEFVEEVILPDWNETSCPLCIESLLLDHLVRGGVVQPGSILSDRADQLRNATDEGLVEKIFLRLPSTRPLQVTRGSYFVKEGATEAVVLCSVAAAVQELRNNVETDKRLDATGFPVRRVFSINDLDRYTDGILRASLLRCMAAVEFRRNSSEKDKQFFNWAHDIFNKKDDESLSTQPELVLAIGLRKIPISVDDTAFNDIISNPNLSDLLPLIKAGKI